MLTRFLQSFTGSTTISGRSISVQKNPLSMIASKTQTLTFSFWLIVVVQLRTKTTLELSLGNRRAQQIGTVLLVPGITTVLLVNVCVFNKKTIVGTLFSGIRNSVISRYCTWFTRWMHKAFYHKKLGSLHDMQIANDVQSFDPFCVLTFSLMIVTVLCWGWHILQHAHIWFHVRGN